MEKNFDTRRFVSGLKLKQIFILEFDDRLQDFVRTGSHNLNAHWDRLSVYRGTYDEGFSEILRGGKLPESISHGPCLK